MLGIILSLVLVLGLMPGMRLTAYAASTYSLVPVEGQSGETYSITPSEDTLDAVKTALAAEMSLDTGTKEIWLYDDEYGGHYEADHLRNTMYYKVKSKPQEIVAGKTYVIGDSLYFYTDKYYDNGYVQTGFDIFGQWTDLSKGQEFVRISYPGNANFWFAEMRGIFKLEEPSGHTFDPSVQPIGFKLADDSGDGSTAEKYIKFEAVYASSKTDQIVTAPVAVSNLTYTGSAQTLVSAATVTTGNTSGSITYSLDGTNYSADLPTGTNVGTYNVYYKVAGNDDYNEFVSASPVSVSIGKATPTVTAPTATNPTYTGAAQNLITAGSTTGGEMQYALGTKDAATEEYTTSIPTATEAGTYYVWYKVVGDSNYLDSDAGYVTVTIATAESSDSGSGDSSSGSSDNTNTNTDTNTDTDTSAKVSYEDVAISTGSVKDITGTATATAESNPFGTKIENSSNLTTLLSLTDAEVAQGVNVWLDVQDMSASVPQTDKTLIQNTSGDYTVGLYLDINLLKKVGSNAATKVTETKGKVKASIVIPESLWKSGRTFEIIRVHDGVATAIAGTYDENTHVFTFETDKFSTYALAYKDPASSSNSGTTSNSGSSNSSNSTQATAPKTGDSNDIRVWYLLLIASLGGLGFLGYSKKKEN